MVAALAVAIFIVDRLKDRLALAEHMGATPIDGSKGSPVEQLQDPTEGKGADKGCECVGYQAHDTEGYKHSNMTLKCLSSP